MNREAGDKPPRKKSKSKKKKGDSPDASAQLPTNMATSGMNAPHILTSTALVASNEEFLTGLSKRLSLDVEHEDYILVCNQEPLDLAFIIDASASIWKRNFTIGLEFVQDFIDMYDIGPDKVRVAVVTFGRGVYTRESFNFSSHETKDQLLDAVKNIYYTAGLWTGTGDAIHYFHKHQLPDARPDVPHLCIVLTDGNSQRPRKTKKAAENARKAGVKMFAIGVGDRWKVKDSELIAIAGNKTRTFRTNNYARLKEVKQKLAFQTCYKKPKPTTPPAAQPCGVEFPTDMEFIYDAASLGIEGNSFVTTFTSHMLSQEGMEQGIQLGVSSALCPNDSGFQMGKYSEAISVKERLDSLYDPKRLGNIVNQGLVQGLSVEHGGRPSSTASKVAVVFVGGKLDTDHLLKQLLAANKTIEGGVDVYFSDVGGTAGIVADLAQKFKTPPLIGSSLQQSATLHTALCG